MDSSLFPKNPRMGRLHGGKGLTSLICFKLRYLELKQILRLDLEANPLA